MNTNYQNDVQIFLVKELTEILKKQGRNIDKFDRQLFTNLCFVYFINDSKVIVLPNDLNPNSKGFLIKNQEVFENILKDDYFPIEPEYPFFYNEKIKELVNIYKNIDLYKKDTLVQTGINLDSLNEDKLKELFEKMSKKKIRSYDNFLRFTALLGAYLIDTNSGKWILIKRYLNYNPYYMPAILFEDESVYKLFEDFEDYYFNRDDLDFYFFLLPNHMSTWNLKSTRAGALYDNIVFLDLLSNIQVTTS